MELILERFRLGLSGELAIGPLGRGFDDCPLNSMCPANSSVWLTQLDVQARVRLDVFLHPNLSLGVGYAESLVTPHEYALTIGLGIHARPLDGMW